ncbi:Protein IDA like [Actinidia chinensis var. chinensis]|uniref:Protein IDA like n=1 Tax=Actinidia chinensis var. chinensis TaxID=1590841 RepID=A0A2R6PH55_ACTCC|nr:Protein IDA like [Actinidia chinensis var. chinensis]
MASSPKSKSLSQNLILFLFLVFGIGCVVASRPMMPEHFKHDRTMQEGLVFNMFPKGTPIPPSGPSPRHNSVGDSSPHN